MQYETAAAAPPIKTVLNPEAIIGLCTTLPLIFPIKKNELAVATIEYNKALLIDTFEPDR
jgi:hypothetical protein